MSDFEQFWSSYPLKVGKLAAAAEFKKAIKKATIAELLFGVEGYKANKPAWQEWAHPRTWLHQGRWLDEWDTPVVKPDMHGHVPPCKTLTECIQKVIDDGRTFRLAK